MVAVTIKSQISLRRLATFKVTRIKEQAKKSYASEKVLY